MFPYFDERNNVCKIYKTSQGSYQVETFCKEGGKPCTECAKLSAIITQNIDGLHQAAGSQNVIELHGSVHRNYCVRCGESHTLSHILDSDQIPRCRKCNGMVRPDVVLYGEGLDNEAFSRAEEAVYNADVLIVGGTSLTVHPASSLVDAFEGNI